MSTSLNFCTINGSQSYKKKFSFLKNDAFSKTNQGLTLSSIGLGLYKGGTDHNSRKLVCDIIKQSIFSGVNVFDVARKYRNGFSEIDLGKTIRQLIQKKKIYRDQIFISSKVGLINFPKKINQKNYIKEILIKNRGIKSEDIKFGLFCSSKNFIAQEIDISLKNLKIKTLDNYYIHNPEFLEGEKNNYKEFYKIFETMEELVVKNKIKSYGISTWSGFRRFKKNSFYIDINKIIKIAKNVGGNNNNFLNIQLPLNICMPFTNCNYKVEKKNLFDFLNENKKNIFTSASLYEGKIYNFLKLLNIIKHINLKNKSLEDNISSDLISLPHSKNSALQLFQTINCYIRNPKIVDNFLDKNIIHNSLNLIRSTKGVVTALCGSDTKKHLMENLLLLKKNKMNKSITKKFWFNFTKQI